MVVLIVDSGIELSDNDLLYYITCALFLMNTEDFLCLSLITYKYIQYVSTQSHSLLPLVQNGGRNTAHI